eukprot:symbB.v1.2.012288.t1/scaffold847.1/size158198/3
MPANRTRWSLGTMMTIGVGARSISGMFTFTSRVEVVNHLSWCVPTSTRRRRNLASGQWRRGGAPSWGAWFGGEDNRIKTDGKVPKGLHVLDGKSVYLLMPDRFARSGAAAANTSSCSGNGWCNGTLKGITEHLDYIKGTLVPCHPKR